MNFGKYATSVAAVVIGSAHPDFTSASSYWPMQRVLYIVLLVASTVYSFAWDILMDFAYFQRKPDGTWAPRKLIVGPSRKYLMTLDLIGRCAWGYTIIVRPPGDRYCPEGPGAGACASFVEWRVLGCALSLPLSATGGKQAQRCAGGPGRPGRDFQSGFKSG